MPGNLLSGRPPFSYWACLTRPNPRAVGGDGAV